MPLKKVLAERNAEAMDVSPIKKKGAKKRAKTVEETYKKLTQLEHILQRPDTYIGSIETSEDTMMPVYDNPGGFTHRKISYVPGLYKIFDEILVNAADNKRRDPSMNKLDVVIDREENMISVSNTGAGIPVKFHDKEKMYVPQLVFGELLAGSNFDDKEKKVTGGRNGYGAKLCNIFSTKFIVETGDETTGQQYRQVFKDNMGYKGEPAIKKLKTAPFTKVTFWPDLERFKMAALDDDFVALITRRVYDVAGILGGVKVTLNGERIKIKNFKSYVDMALSTRDIDYPILHTTLGERWEIAVTISDSGGFQQMSFVNAIATTNGGKHVDAVVSQLVDHLLPVVKKKNPDAKSLKPANIKSFLHVFINCLIENPSFTSQSKETMNLSKKDFGSSCTLPKAYLTSIDKCGIIDHILTFATKKASSKLAKQCSGTKRSRLTGIPKLDDANEAGGRNSQKCTLILTEGDSAKALAVSGLGVVGRDYYGVFPLRGKLLNVRDASSTAVQKNAEIQAIVQIMGLKYGKVYTATKELRYGRLMIMTDQDQDGSHIKGLLINFIENFWPSLLKMNGFLIEFVTPIVKCTKGKKEHSFFTLPEYDAWRETQASLKGWKIKYYKGLGTSTPKEAKEYFSNLGIHEIPFEYDDGCRDNLQLAFAKDRVDDRKEWLAKADSDTFLDHAVDAITYSDFINKELVLFSISDNVRSIPCIMDGLKPGQRKILFSCFKRNLKQEIKVAQLAGYVSENSAYHHGEVSLCSTIVNMAQDYIGANNIGLLLPIGQFGTRLQGGKDAASARYIFTNLSPLTRCLFKPEDEPLLKYLTDDGQSIEPEWYAPIIPMSLINGADGIGTGWATSIPNYNPSDVLDNLVRMMDGKEPQEMHPWYRGFTGEIVRDPKKAGRYLVRGAYEETDDGLEITELPLGMWTVKYKDSVLEPMMDNKSGAPAISDYKEFHTDRTVHFKISMTEEQMKRAKSKGLVKMFKLEGSVATTNMVLFDNKARLTKYQSPVDVIKEFFHVRRGLYMKRKEILVDQLTNDFTRLSNKVRFILAVINEELQISKRKKKEIYSDLKAQGFDAFPKKAKKQTPREAAAESEEDEMADTGSASDYDYLLSMPMWNLTYEKVEKLTAEKEAKEQELDTLLQKSPEDLWREDLVQLKEELRVFEVEAAAEAADLIRLKKKAQRNTGSKKKKASRKQKADSDFEEDDDWQPTVTKRKAAAAPKPAKLKSARARAPVADKENAVPDVAMAVSPPPKAAKKLAPKAKKKPAKALVRLESDSEGPESDDGGFGGSLMARLKAKKGKGAAAAARKTSAKRKVMSPLKAQPQSDSEDDDDAFDAMSARAHITKKPRSMPSFDFDSESDEEEEEEEVYKPAPKAAVKKAKAPAKKAKASAKKKAAPAPKPKAAKAAPKKSRKKVISSDDESDFEIDEEESKSAPTPAAPRARSRRTVASKKYTFDEDSDVELLEESESDFQPDDDSDGEWA